MFWRVNVHTSSAVKPVGTEGVAEGLDWFGGCVGAVGADPEMSGQKT